MQKLCDLLENEFPELPLSLTYYLTIGIMNDSLSIKVGIAPTGRSDAIYDDWSNQYYAVGIPYEIAPALVDYLMGDYPADTYNLIDIQDGSTIEVISGDKAFEVSKKILSDAKESIQRFLDVYNLL